ncbi:MAG: alpha/beta hydrolase, partial [Anaerolineae bacterium]
MTRRVLTNVSKRLVAVIGISSVITVAFLVLPWTAWSGPAAVPELRDFSHHAPASTQEWGEPVAGITTTYAIYKQDFVYGDSPFLTTDMRPEDKYLDKESYEIRALTVYRAHDGQALLERQPVVFFVHGGAWIDGYRDWYEFVAHSFTGEMGWVTVVIDYRLTSDEVFIADQYCPDRDTCGRPENEPYRTKAGWYPDNIEDVASAFQWVVEHIDENGGDAGKIVVFGHSAGGHLASLLATHPDYETSLRPAIKGLVTMSGAYELNSLNKVFWHDAVTQTFQGGFGNTDLLEQASPAGYVVAGTRLPSFYILYAEDDLLNLTEQNVMFKNQLETLGFDVTASYLAGYSHVTEMEAIADVNATPTQLIVDW